MRRKGLFPTSIGPRGAALAALLLALLPRLTAGQTSAPATAGAGPAEAAGQPPGPPAWSSTFTLNGYLFPGSDDDFLLGIGAADHGALHLEARWNYEAPHTGSLWAGWNWSTGTTVEFAITPMFGIVVGETDGVAPGFETSLTWKRLDYYLEAEAVLDAGDHDDSFIYAWSELAITPWDWLRVGLVGQRTRVYETGLDIQRGLLAQAIVGHVALGVDWFNPGSEDEFVVAVVEIEF